MRSFSAHVSDRLLTPKRLSVERNRIKFRTSGTSTCISYIDVSGHVGFNVGYWVIIVSKIASNTKAAGLEAKKTKQNKTTTPEM